MRTLFISGNRENSGPMTPLPLGLACVAAATVEAGFTVEVVDPLQTPDWQAAIRSAIEAARPDVIGLSVRNIDNQVMIDTQFLLEPVKDIVAFCRDRCNAPIVLGGGGFSIFPESALAYLGVHMGIVGEGETAFPKLLAWLESGRQGSPPAGVCLAGAPQGYRPDYLQAITADLNWLALPPPALWLRGEINPSWRIPVQTRRGCANACSYCSTGAIEGRHLRYRTPHGVICWLARYCERGFRNFYFVDNTFNLPMTYAKELCRKIIEARLDITWSAIVYPKWVDTELTELMARAGCAEVGLGFESGVEAVLRLFNKKFIPAEVAEIAALFAAVGIKRSGFLLLGAPGDTRETVEESLTFAESLRLDFLKVSAGIRIYPKTALAARAVSEGLIERGDDLLLPKFYCVPQLREWLPRRIADYNKEGRG
jgi:radical SAM superfamily enzyme YgiQ (UPF0313 family)